MNYSEWNQALFDFFFNESQRGKTVLLDIDTGDFSAIYTAHLSNNETHEEHEAINSFIVAIISGPPIMDLAKKVAAPVQHGFTNKILAIEKYYYLEHNQGKYKVCALKGVTPLFAYAVAFTYGAKKGAGGYYNGLYNLLGNNFPENDADTRNCIQTTWNRVEQDIANRGDELGMFFNKKDSPGTRKYVEKVLSQFIVPRTEYRRLPSLFWDLGLHRDDAGNPRVKAMLLANEAIVRKYIPVASAKLNGRNGDELLVLDIINKALINYEGKAEFEEATLKNITIQKKIEKLKLAFEKHPATGKVQFNYYFRLLTPVDETLVLGGKEVWIDFNGWSSAIERPGGKTFSDPFLLVDQQAGFKAVFQPTKDYFLFGAGISQGLPNEVYIEAGHPERSGTQYFLAKDAKLSNFKEWLEENEAQKQDNLPIGGWSLYRLEGYKRGLPGYQDLQLPATVTATISGGLRAKANGTFIAGFPFSVHLEGFSGREQLLVDGFPPVDFNPFVNGFVVDFLQNIGTYQLVISEIANSQTVGIVNDGKIIIAGFDGLIGNDYEASLQTGQGDQFNEKPRNDKFLAFIANVKDFKRPPLQFTIWADQEIQVVDDLLHAPAVQLLHYLAYRGEQGKQSFDASLSAFYANNQLATSNYIDFKNYTLYNLVDSCRVMINRGERGQARSIVPLAPFLCRLGNANSAFFNATKTKEQVFSGELFFLGGCYQGKHIELLAVLSEQPAYRDVVTIKIFAEQDSYALIPPSLFLYINGNTNFIAKAAEIIGNRDVVNYFDVLPHIPSVASLLAAAVENPGENAGFHDPTRCALFDTTTLAYQPYTLLQLPPNALVKYKIRDYYSLVNLHFNGNVATVNEQWGKFMLFHLTGLNILFFDANKNVLVVRLKARLPQPIPAYLYLCTGRLPYNAAFTTVNNVLEVSATGSYYAVYQGLVHSLAENLAKQLGQQLNLTTIII
ncbi:hypothetical protein ACCC92_11265 [Mucilaginibacter sp. Mucisp84]|uniref:hypothetical protein n=1 Tax=Mucilaginibacter sp. Mucisp84 TaxID=3243058 RepID=UPI0039A515FD